MADYNLTPVLNGFAKNVQKTDTESESGKRNILFSKYRFTLDGFNFNRNYPFNSVVRVGVIGEINRENLTAKVSIPRINTDIDIQNVLRLPYFRLIIALGAISDMHFDNNVGGYEPTVPALHGVSVAVTGEWVPSENILAEQLINISLGDELLPFFNDEVSLVLSMAIEFGKVGFTGATQEVKYAGCGKVIKVS